MGLVLELLPKVIIDNQNILGEIVGYDEGTSELNYLNANSSNNQNTNIPESLQNALNTANNSISKLTKDIAKGEEDLNLLEARRATILAKLKSDNTPAISEAIAISGKCGSYKYENGQFTVPMKNNLYADGCAHPFWGAIVRGEEVKYAINAANVTLPQQIEAVNNQIQRDKESLEKAKKDAEDAQKAIDKYLETQEKNAIKNAEAANLPQIRQIQAQNQARLKELQIQAQEREKALQIQAQIQARRMENRSKNTRIGLFVLGGLALTGGLIYYFNIKK